jgi:hypothetical protein
MAVQLGQQQECQVEEDTAQGQEQEQQQNSCALHPACTPELSIAPEEPQEEHSSLAADEAACSSGSASPTTVHIEVVGSAGAFEAGGCASSDSSRDRAAEVYERYSCTGWGTGAGEEIHAQGLVAGEMLAGSGGDPYTIYGDDDGDNYGGKGSAENEAAEEGITPQAKAKGGLRDLQLDDLD